jgi:cardiolipin synthase
VPLQQLANLITSLRLVSSPVLVWLLIQSEFKSALGLVLFAGLTDWLDGFTARHFSAAGKLGTILDPVADKTMLVALFVTLGVLRLIPLWLVALVIGRDVVIVTGSALLRAFRNIRRFAPSLLGKVSTFFQIVFVLLVLLDAAFPNQVFRVLKDLALLCTAVFTFLSGLGYIRLGIRLAREPAAVGL